MNWITIKNFIIQQLKGAAVEAALLKFLGTATGVGFKAWLIKKLITKFSNEIGEPVARGILNNVGYLYEKVDGIVLIKKLRKAESDGDQPEYDDIVDDILS